MIASLLIKKVEFCQKVIGYLMDFSADVLIESTCKSIVVEEKEFLVLIIAYFARKLLKIDCYVILRFAGFTLH